MVRLRARQFNYGFPGRALIMGIVNVTPDSFWDGGKYFDSRQAIDHGLKLFAEGADMLDVGGESTRPGARPVDEQEELRRVIPVVEGLVAKVSIPVSIDTMKEAVARQALRAGAAVVNDVGANREDSALWRLAAEHGAAYVCMHMQGAPRTMQVDPHYEDVVAEVEAFFVQRLQKLSHCGLGAEQSILDPGIGFGKSLAHNLALLGSIGRFVKLERPLLLGVSRKSFMGKLLGVPAEERLPAGLACACLAVAAGAAIIRTHDVVETLQAVRMCEGILANAKK